MTNDSFSVTKNHHHHHYHLTNQTRSTMETRITNHQCLHIAAVQFWVSLDYPTHQEDVIIIINEPTVAENTLIDEHITTVPLPTANNTTIITDRPNRADQRAAMLLLSSASQNRLKNRPAIPILHSSR